jgi:hypothetical protein
VYCEPKSRMRILLVMVGLNYGITKFSKLTELRKGKF